MTTRTFVQSLAKSELHIHIEGSLEPDLMFDLAKRNGIDLPYSSVEEIGRAYDFGSLQDFLDLYYEGLKVIRNSDDFYSLTDAYLRRVKKDNVNHVEMFFDPQAHTERGVAIDTVMDGMLRAMEDHTSEDFSVALILCILRHLSEDDAIATLELAEPYRDSILGIGLDSSEVGHPPSKFRKVYEEARKQGYRLVAHAGEEGPPEYVWEALDVLGVDRIDHGNRAMEDPALVNRIERDGIALTVCPLSNLKLCVVDELRNHPLKRMLDAGLVATVNSDDPAYFGGYINDNFVAVADALNLSETDLRELATNSQKARLC